MPSDTRSTEQRTFSIAVEASEGIDEYAAENNMSKSMVVETAVLDYLEESQADQIEEKVDNVEEKVDEVLANLDGSPNPSPSSSQTSGEKENVGGSPSDFDPEAYDPDADRDEPLSKDEVKQLLSALDEPAINPEHITDESLSMNDKSGPVAAIVRYEREGNVGEGTLWNQYIPEYIGDTDYLLEKYTDSITNHFRRKYTIELDDEDNSYVRDGTAMWFTTEEAEAEFYEDKLAVIREAIDTPAYEMSEFNYWYQSYEYLRCWLRELRFRIEGELELITEEEFDELEQGLLSQRDEVDDCLDVIRDLLEGYRTKEFNRDDAIESLPYDENSAEELLNLFDKIDYIGEYESGRYEWGLVEGNIIRGAA